MQREPRSVRNARSRPIRPNHRRSRGVSFTISVGPFFELVVRQNPRQAVRNQRVIRFKGACGRQSRFHFVIGEGETAESAVPRQERIRGHRTNNREKGMCLVVQVPEEEFRGNSAEAV